MSTKELKCPKCSAPVSLDKHVCEYCGTYYVVEGRIAYTLNSRPATDENLKLLLEKTNMIMRHMEESGRYIRFISEKELEQYALMARDHLRKELEREPTIDEVDERAYQYLLPIKHEREQQDIYKQVHTQTMAAYAGWILASIIITFIMLLLLRL